MGFKDKIKANLGQSRPPRVSINGNVFTLMDAAGNERPAVHTLDIIMIDGNANKSRTYREASTYNPNDPLPPDCFSDNGEAPSSYALKPQSDSCHTCQWARRGSATSKVSGKPISACDDSQKLAVILPDDPSRMVFQLTITKGSLQSFRAYMDTLGGHKYEPEEVITRLSFVSKVTGVLQFEPIGEVDDDTKTFIAGTAGSAALKYVTGEDDVPIGALPAPAARPQLSNRERENVEISARIAAENRPVAAEPEAPKSHQPTREELERELAKLRAAKEEKPKRAALKAVETPQQGEVLPPEHKPQPDIPAFLRKAAEKPPSNGAFGMANNAAPIPDEVDKLVSQHANGAGAQAPGLADRLGKAFGLPLRS